MNRLVCFLLFSIAFFIQSKAQTLVLDTTMFGSGSSIYLADTGTWLFNKGSDPEWARPDLITVGWDTLRPVQITTDMADENGIFEGWFRIRIKLDSSFAGIEVGMIQRVWAATDVFVDGTLVRSFGNTGLFGGEFDNYDRDVIHPTPLPLVPGQEHVIAIHAVDEKAILKGRLKSEVKVLPGFFVLTAPDYELNVREAQASNNIWWAGFLTGSALLAVLFWLIYFLNPKEKHLLFIAVAISGHTTGFLPTLLERSSDISFELQQFYDLLRSFLFVSLTVLYPLTLGQIFKGKILRLHWFQAALAFAGFISMQLFNLPEAAGTVIGITAFLTSLGFSLYYVISSWRTLKGAKWAVVGGILVPIMIFIVVILMIILERIFGIEGLIGSQGIGTVILLGFFLAFPISLVVYVILWFRDMMQDITSKSESLVKAAEEKQKILDEQKVELARKVEERTAELKQSLQDLKATQNQLIHAEKMASLGELTAGIAHEIQNPLNFVNNFSEVSKELMDEMIDELKKGDVREADKIAADIVSNLDKITHHGQRADSIVKGMLQHSRNGDGEKQPTDLNNLVDEYVRLAYHGLRAKDKSFNASITTDFDDAVGDIEIIPQDIGRVLLNLLTNAFHAVNDKRQYAPEDFKPVVAVSTKRSGSGVEIRITDNGSGIPEAVQDKIFQPFFTTKPAGEGTGLGLSMSYDIVTNGHRGQLLVTSEEGAGSIFTVLLPLDQ